MLKEHTSLKYCLVLLYAGHLRHLLILFPGIYTNSVRMKMHSNKDFLRRSIAAFHKRNRECNQCYSIRLATAGKADFYEVSVSVFTLPEQKNIL